MPQIQKEKEDRAASYKKYTLKDYKQLNKEVKLGGLGPSADPDVLKEKVLFATCTLDFKHKIANFNLMISKQDNGFHTERAE